MRFRNRVYTHFIKSEQLEKLEALIADFNLGKVRKNMGDQLSGGERRKNQGNGYGKALIDFLAEKYAEEYSILQVGTGDSPLTIPFYEKCGFIRSHKIPNFFIDNYNHPIYEGGVQLIDMVYLQRYL